jgi:hypothetical protein
MIKNFTLGLLLVLAAGAQAPAQERPEGREGAAAPAVTISVSAKGVRFAALGAVKQIRLEVFTEGGDPVYGSGFQPGNVRDWRPEDRQGQRLPDGRYLCVVTFRDLSGRLGMKQGALVMRGGRPSLEMAEVEQAGAAEPEKALAAASGEAPAEAVTLTAHDGEEGRLVSTRGGLSFRAGDFFAGADKGLMRITPEGRVGIGLDTPEAALDVAGAVRARGGFRFSDGTTLDSSGGRLTLTGADGSNIPAATAEAVGTGTLNRLAKWAETGGAGTLTSSQVTESAEGNVGVGTPAPGNVLEVRRDQAFDGNETSMTQLRVRNDSATGFSALSVWGSGAERGRYQFNAASPNMFLTSLGRVPLYLGANNTVRVAIDGVSGNVGVGTSNPSNVLEVRKDQPFAGPLSSMTQVVVRNDDPAGLASLSVWGTGAERGRYQFNAGSPNMLLTSVGAIPLHLGTNNTVRLSVDGNTGNVGVGTLSPGNVFEVRRDQPFGGTEASMTQLRVRNDNPTGFSSLSVWGGGQERGRYQYNGGQPNIFLTSMGQIPFYFGTNNTVRMSVDAVTGNVGIGTGFTPATQKLEVAGSMHVTGNAVVDGNIAAKYQDVAEWVPGSGELSAGTVVTLDVTRVNAVLPAARAYDTGVAGVVSAQPGLILGQGGEGKVLVATTGRVKVRVDATRRAVRVGDLLVTSGRAGVAMRSVPVRAGGVLMHRPGTIIGKALEPLAGREGEILVLLSLQ